MIQKIDEHKLNILRDTACNYASPDVLRRDGKVFFIGCNLPIYNTLETMYESYCLESSELFHVTFGTAAEFGRNIEMVRQIKRNFSIRLMGQISYPLSVSQVERVYLAGLDILDFPHDAGDRDQWTTAFSSATAAFTRWSVASSIIAGQTTPQAVKENIKELLDNGIIPLLTFAEESSGWSVEEAGGLSRFLAAEWHRHRVPLKPVMPLLRLTTPYVFAGSPGFLREVIDKLHDRHILATSDIRRHLRTSGAEASFESAGL